MSLIITPKNAIEVVLKRKIKPLAFAPYDNNLQRWFFWSSVMTLLFGSILGWSNKWINSHAIGIFALVLILFSAILSIVYQILILLPLVNEIKNPEKTVTEPLIADFNSDIDLITELSTTYERHHLEYAKNSILQIASQIKVRVALLVGSIEKKVGIIPIGITAYFSIQKALDEKIFAFSEIEGLLVGLVVLYIFAVQMVFVAHRFERIVLIYEQALLWKPPVSK